MTEWGAGRLVLAIETSCDDTSVALLEDGARLRAHVVAGQDVHRLYGGVVPELASRAHLTQLPLAMRAALDEAGGSLEDVTGLAVTHAPGLVGSLVIGVAYAKALALSLGRPLVGIDHIEAHLHSAGLEHGEAAEPFVALVVSGGHTELVSVPRSGEAHWLGATLDDAAGEAFDKVAKRLGLGFPGGPAIEALAREGRADAFAFPRPMLDRPGCDLSFSGLKTAVGHALAGAGPPPWPRAQVADVAASFQAAVVETLVEKCARALAMTGARVLRLGGGVACNGALRAALAARCESLGVTLQVPAPRFCVDNAAMIAWVGARRLARGEAAGPELDAASSLGASGLA